PSTTEIYTLSLHDALPICKLKGQFNKIFSNDLIKLALSPISIVQYGLIDYIPTLYPALVPRNNSLDMLSHPFDQHFPRNIFEILVNKKPMWSLGMPDQGMPNKSQTIFLAQFNKSVCISKIKFSFNWLKVHGFHTILRSNRIKLRCY